MFKVVLIILLKITMAMLPYEDYGGGYFYSSDDDTSSATSVTEEPRREQRHGARAYPEALLKLQGNIQKLLAGQVLPREVTDPARTSFFESVDDAGTTQGNIQLAIPATDRQTYMGATRPFKYFPKNVERAVQSVSKKTDQLSRLEELYRWMPNVPRRNYVKNGRQIGYPYDGIDRDIWVARQNPSSSPESHSSSSVSDASSSVSDASSSVSDASNSSVNDSSSSSSVSNSSSSPVGNASSAEGSTNATARTRATTSTTTRRTRTTTTVTTTPTPVCTDELGYRVRCTNATVPSTTTLRSRRRKTKPTKRTKRSRRTTTVTTTSTTITTFSTTFDPNATTINMMGVNTTTVTTTTSLTPTQLTTTTTETDSTETTLTTKRTRRLPWIRRSTVREPNDIDRILMILDNLTYIYETNVVDRLNETLELEGYPYCPTVRTRVTTTTTPKSWPITEDTGKVKAKTHSRQIFPQCFVCGMDVPGIPRESQCADAFAPDHFPGASLIYPPTHVGRYKKHCKYLDMPTWHINGTEGRSMWGAWDGGCSVRWVDLSGVYTQRSCRARHKPAIGRHLVSKRLAKMEYALNMLDNGCIGSAQASLVPFSRGISLYARFYACVCTGTYCNGARRLRPLATSTAWYTVGLAVTVLRWIGNG